MEGTSDRTSQALRGTPRNDTVGASSDRHLDAKIALIVGVNDGYWSAYPSLY